MRCRFHGYRRRVKAPYEHMTVDCTCSRPQRIEDLRMIKKRRSLNAVACRNGDGSGLRDAAGCLGAGCAFRKVHCKGIQQRSLFAQHCRQHYHGARSDSAKLNTASRGKLHSRCCTLQSHRSTTFRTCCVPSRRAGVCGPSGSSMHSRPGHNANACRPQRFLPLRCRLPTRRT